MKFKGYNFTRTKNIVTLPSFDSNGFPMSYVQEGKENYVVFGRVTKVGANKKGAFKTTSKWIGGKNDGEYVYAVPIESNGYSLTNMMYGKDNKIYLAKKGSCFTVSMKKVKEELDVMEEIEELENMSQ